MSRDLELRMLGPQARSELRSDARRSAQQKETKTPCGAQLREWRDEVGPRDGSGHRAALPPRGPDHPRAVGQAQVGGLEHARELAVTTGSHDELRVDRGDEVMAAGVDELLDAVEGGLHVKAVDPHAQDPDLHHFLSGSVGLASGGSGIWGVSISRTVVALLGIRLPKPRANSASDSPPPARTRVHRYRSVRL